MNMHQRKKFSDEKTKFNKIQEEKNKIDITVDHVPMVDEQFDKDMNARMQEYDELATDPFETNKTYNSVMDVKAAKPYETFNLGSDIINLPINNGIIKGKYEIFNQTNSNLGKTLTGGISSGKSTSRSPARKRQKSMNETTMSDIRMANNSSGGKFKLAIAYKNVDTSMKRPV